MRIKWVGVGLLLSLALRLAALADCAQPPVGLVSWWPADINANDIAFTNNGTLQGGATISNAYFSGQAFVLNGTNAFVQIPDSPSLRPTNFTIECFVQFNSLDSAGSGAPAGSQYIVFKQNSRNSSFEGFDLGKSRVGTNDVFRFVVSSAAGQSVSIQSTTTISAGVWYHLAAVRGSNFVQLYVNNVLERQTNVTFAQDYGNFPLYFGTSGQAFWDRKFNGILEEVSIYNRALTPAEIANIYYAYGWGKCKAAQINGNPRSATVFVGANVAFNVSATGVGTLAYQWRSNGIPIPGASGSSLSFTNVPRAASADYSVVVSNSLGTATSAPATLAVLPPPSVVLNVDLGDGPFGAKTGFAAVGTSANDFWNAMTGAGSIPHIKTGGSNATPVLVTVPYAMNNWLIPSAMSGDPMVDDYLWWPVSSVSAVVSNLPVGQFNFYLYSHDGNFQLSSGGVDYGSKSSFEGFPLSNPPAWAEYRQYVTFPNVRITNAAQAVVITANRATFQPDAIFSGFQITGNAPWILKNPSNAVVAVNGNLVLQVATEATPAPTFQWFFNNSSLADGGRVIGAASNTLVIASAQIGDSGSYFVVVTNASGATTSLVATVQVGFPPSVTQSPSSQTNLAGTTAQFLAQVIGDAPMGFQWFFNGFPLVNDPRHSGVTTTNLNVSSVAEIDEGSYVLVASNAMGVVTSAVATLTVLSPPSITSQPANQYVLLNRPATFSVSVAGDVPLSFRWYFGSTPLADGGRFAGATSNTLTIQGAQASDVGGYSVIVGNAWGSITSSVASLNLATVRYVNINNPTPAPPYLTWATAATVIQEAINVAGIGDLILVTNGTYQSGSVSVPQQYYASHRIALDKPLTVMSVNGPAVTSIVGGGASFGRRCAYLTNGAVLAGFTLTGGRTDLGDTSSLNQRGAGVLCQSVSCIISNCVISGNIAGRQGGGAYSGTLINCTVSGNTSRDIQGARTGDGGGTYSSNLRNCIVVNNGARYGGGGVMLGAATNCVLRGNSAVWGGGAYIGTLVNCTVVGNTSVDDGGLGGAGGGGVASGSALNSIIVQNTGGYGAPNYWGGGFSYCCTSPQPGGTGNFNADPRFVDFAGGNYRLANDSPCINGGAIVPGTPGVDLDGLPRVVGGTVDLGAYESQEFPWVVVGPLSQGVLLSSNVGFAVSTVGAPPFGYQWQKDGVNLSDDGRINGSTTAALTISNLVAPDAGGYRVIAANPFGVVTSSVANLTVLLPPTVVVAPTNQAVGLGATASFSVLAAGSPPLSYQWRKESTTLVNGGTISGANTALLQIANAGSNDGGSYDVVVTSPYGATTSAPALLTLLPLAINAPPVSRTVPAGTNVTFTVSASGYGTIFYQWRFNQTDLPGQTNFFMTLTNVQSAHAGDYDVMVTNLYNALTSSVATLIVSPAAPIITTQAVSRVASVGQTVSFVVAARGSEPMTCQWQRNGADLSGANAFTLTLDNVNSSHAGTYRAAVSNEFGFAFSTNVTLIVSPVLAWQTNNQQFAGNISVPASATNVMAIAAGKVVDYDRPCFAIRADGSLIEWGGNAQIPASATNVLAVSASGQGSRAENNLVLRGDGSVVHWNSGSGVRPLPPAITNGDLVAVAAGAQHQLVLRSDGTVFAWGNGGLLQTNVPASATNVIAIAAGTDTSLALRADGKVVVWGPKASSQAAAFSNVVNVAAISAGGNQVLGLLENGGAVGYVVTNNGPQTTFYGPPPSSATNLTAVSAGVNHCLALRADGSVLGWGNTNYGQTTLPVIATNVVAIAAGVQHSLALVRDPFAPPIPPRIGRPPLGRALNAGDNVVFNAVAVGGLPLHFQWLHNGVPLQGRTNQWLAMTNVSPADAGNYQLVATNDSGAVTSAVAVVTVDIPQPALKLPAFNGNTFSFTLNTVAGIYYASEFRNDLPSGTWTEFDHRLGVGGLELIVDTNALSQTRFYRVRAIYPPPP
ncbi:MAG TPA: immunoglobulin domain-containing protein [Verrucomicrobiae bacterium]|nr:immunoglobulin domain-containing protein [Verrucomicrobiae bacterium]